MGEWMEKYNDAERQLDHYRIQATKISRIVPQKIRELEERATEAERKLNLERKNNIQLEQQMSEEIAGHHDLIIQNETLQAQIHNLKRELAVKDESILAISAEIEKMRDLRQRDEESVRQKVKLIKDHIHKSIRNLEVENIRLKRKVETVENEQLIQLNTEIVRLREINMAQARNRLSIFDEAYKKCCRDYNLSSPKMENIGPPPPWSPIYQHTSSVSSQDPLYSSITPEATNNGQLKQALSRSSSLQSQPRISPPLPPRRTSASTHTVEEKRRKLPSNSSVTCCSPSCCPSKSSYESHYHVTSSPPPLSLREQGDGSVSNDYDEIPCDGAAVVVKENGFSPSHSLIRVRSTSDSRLQQRVGMCTPPHLNNLSSPHLNNVRSPAQMNGNDPMSPRDLVSPRSVKHGKRSWETLVDSLALVGFSDVLPQQRCVKSSIGKLPIYTVSEQMSYTDHPYETPPYEDDQESPASPTESVTEMERLIDKIKFCSEGQQKQLLSSPLLSYTAQPLTVPLTNLTTPYLVMCALRVNKLLLEFAQEPKDLYTTCRTLLTLTNNELVNEVYAQLIKQTHRQPDEIMSYWQMMAVIVPFNIPSGRILIHLKNHLHRYSEQKTSAGRFAGYCARVLQRRLAFGSRQVHPCKMEIEATRGKPYIHSKPMSIPIHLPGGDYHVTGFDTVSSVSEVIRDLESQLGLRTCRWSGYTLFMDDPVNPNVKVPIAHTSKLCDVIAKWETNVKPANNQIPQVIGLTYMKYLHLNANKEMITPLEQKLCAMQVHAAAMRGYHGMEVELATCLGALMAQAREGNCPVRFDTTKPPSPTEFMNVLTEYIERYIPPNITERCKDHHSKRQLINNFGEIWHKFRDVDSDYLYKKYFNTAQRWKYSRSTLFRGLYMQSKDGLKVAVCLNVTENKLTIINADTLVIMDAVDMDKIVKFGGDPFSITLQINNKTLTVMLVDKHKCYLLTELLSSYCRLTHVVERDER